MNTAMQAHKTNIRFVPQAFAGAGGRFAGVDEMIEIPSWHLLPLTKTSPPPRDGEVPFIR